MARGNAIAVRIVLAVGGSYVGSAGLAALGAVAVPSITPLSRSDAVVLSSISAFLIYLSLLIWAFAERRIVRLCIALVVTSIASWATTFALVSLVVGA